MVEYNIYGSQSQIYENEWKLRGIMNNKEVIKVFRFKICYRIFGVDR